MNDTQILNADASARKKRRAEQPKYEVLAKWRNGWQLIKHPATGQHYLRRMMRGQYPVNAVRSGVASWRITDPANNDAVVTVSLLK